MSGRFYIDVGRHAGADALRWVHHILEACGQFAVEFAGSTGGEPTAASLTAPQTTPFLIEDPLGWRFIVAMLFVGALAAIGWTLVLRHRQGHPLARFGGFSSDASIAAEVIQRRRVTPRLWLVTLRIPPNRAVVIADNGASLIKVADFDLSESTSSAGPP